MAYWLSLPPHGLVLLLLGVAVVGVLLIEYYFHRRARHYKQLKADWSQEGNDGTHV